METLKPTAPLEKSPVVAEFEKNDHEAGKPVLIGNLFTHHDTHPITIDFALMKCFGLEWWTWEAETIHDEIRRRFKSEVSELSRSKIQTVKTIHVTDMPWHKWQVFEKIIQGLNNNVPRWEMMQPPTLEQLYAGIDILEQIKSHPFSDEVKLYMGAAVLNDDVFYVPPPLDFVQLEVSQPRYRCNECGQTLSALFSDGTCPSCSRMFDPEQGLSMRPHPSVAERPQTSSLDITYDPEPIAERWSAVEHTPLDQFVMKEDDPVDIQVGKLLVARDYMNLRRRQLSEQLLNLKPWLVSQ